MNEQTNLILERLESLCEDACEVADVEELHGYKHVLREIEKIRYEDKSSVQVPSASIPSLEAKTSTDGCLQKILMKEVVKLLNHRDAKICRHYVCLNLLSVLEANTDKSDVEFNELVKAVVEADDAKALGIISKREGLAAEDDKAGLGTRCLPCLQKELFSQMQSSAQREAQGSWLL